MLEKFDENKLCVKCSSKNKKIEWVDTLVNRINPLAQFGLNFTEEMKHPPEEHLQVSCKRCGFMWYTATDDCYVRVDNSDLNNLLKLATKNTTDQS